MNTLPTQDKSERAGRVILGLLGAFLFSLAGGLCWFTLYRLNLISAISGIVGVVCAIKGYSLFAKKESVGGRYCGISHRFGSACRRMVYLLFL